MLLLYFLITIQFHHHNPQLNRHISNTATDSINFSVNCAINGAEEGFEGFYHAKEGEVPN